MAIIKIPLATLTFLFIVALFLGSCGEAWKATARISMTPYHKKQLTESMQKPMQVAVMPFAYDPSTKIAEQVTEIFISEMSGVYFYSLVERQRIEEILKEHALAMSGIIDEKTAVKIGKMLGARSVLLGRITEYRDDPGWTGRAFFGFSVRLVEVETGIVLWSGNHSLNSGPLSVPDTLNELVIFTIRELIDKLNKGLGL